MNTDEVLRIFKESGALLEGHFILTSGLHSPLFLQKAKVFMDAQKTGRLCKALAEKIQREIKDPFDFLVGPALGGIIPTYETSRYLKVPALWVEREDGILQLRRFELTSGARILIIDDVVTTGLSIRETLACLRNLNAHVIAAACIVDRSGGKVHLDVPLLALAEYKIPVYHPHEIPTELAKIPAVKPGSRKIRSPQ